MTFIKVRAISKMAISTFYKNKRPTSLIIPHPPTDQLAMVLELMPFLMK
jgi:hypothetical protein